MCYTNISAITDPTKKERKHPYWEIHSKRFSEGIEARCIMEAIVMFQTKHPSETIIEVKRVEARAEDDKITFEGSIMPFITKQIRESEYRMWNPPGLDDYRWDRLFKNKY
jgi:hypothetical protein